MSKYRLDRKAGSQIKNRDVKKSKTVGSRSARPAGSGSAARTMGGAKGRRIDSVRQLWEEAAKDKATRVELARLSMAFFAWYYLRSAGAPLAVPKCHRRWYKEIGTGDGYRKRPNRQRRLLLLAPRAHGKSMVVSLVVALHRICFNRNVRILLLSERNDGATKRLKRLRTQLETNKRILEDFGGADGFRDKSQAWTDKGFYVRRTDTTMNEPTVEAAGNGGAIVGGRFDLIIADDPESNNTVLTAGGRAKTRDWFWGTILELLEPWGEAVVIGTRKHHDDLYDHLIKDPTFHTVQDRAIAVWPDNWSFIKDELGRIVDATHHETCDIRTKPKQDMACSCGYAKGVALWPKLWPIGKLLAKRESSPIKSLFDRENQNIVTSNEDARFKLEWLEAAKERGIGVKSWKNSDQVEDGWFIVIGVDPAFVDDEKTASSSDTDFFVASVVAVNRVTWERRILGGFRRRGMTPDAFKGALRALCTPYALANDRFPGGALAGVAIEGNSFGKFYQLGIRKDTSLPLVLHTTTAAKADPYDGVEAMALLFETGKTSFAIPERPTDDASRKKWADYEEHVQFIDAMVAEFYGFGAERHDDTVLAYWIAECYIRRLQAAAEKDKMRREGKRREGSRNKIQPGDSADQAAQRKDRRTNGRRGRGAKTPDGKPGSVKQVGNDEVDSF